MSNKTSGKMSALVSLLSYHIAALEESESLLQLPQPVTSGMASAEERQRDEGSSWFLVKRREKSLASSAPVKQVLDR